MSGLHLRRGPNTNYWYVPDLEAPAVFTLPVSLRAKLPFLIVGFCSFLFSVYLFFVQDDTTAGIFVGLWVPSIHSLGTLLLTPVDGVSNRADREVRS